MARYFRFSILSLILLFIFTLDVDAASYTYRLENIAYAPTQGCSTNGKYSYTLYSSPATYRTGTFGYGDYNINGRMSALSVVFDYSLKANNSYSITFRNPNSSFVKPVLSNVTIGYSSSFNTSNCGTVATRKNPTSVMVSGSDLILYFTTPSTTYEAFGVEINDDLGAYYLTGSGSNFRLNPYVLLTDVTAEGTADSYQQIIDSQNKNTENIIENDNRNHEEFMGTITDSDIDSDLGTGFFDDFSDEDFGLSEIITLPLNTISSLTSKTCQPLSIPIPKTGKNVSLPCMTQVYQQNVPSIFSIWQIVSFGIIAYFVAVDIFHLVKGFKDPESDKVEVLDL